MLNSQIIYKEEKEIYLKFYIAPEILEYRAKIKIKNKGKKPVTVELTFTGIEPLAAPMPPEHHIIKSESISALFPKIVRWAKRYGYVIV